MVRALELVLDRPIEVPLMQWAEAQARVQRGEAHGPPIDFRHEECSGPSAVCEGANGAARIRILCLRLRRVIFSLRKMI